MTPPNPVPHARALAERLHAGQVEQPVRIQRSRRPGWRMPEGAVYVGRPTRWGNPWSIRGAREAGYTGTDQQLATWCVSLFREWISRDPRSDTRMLKDSDQRLAKLEQGLAELRGRNLACWCPLDQPCHADVLLELANEPARRVLEAGLGRCEHG